MELVTESGRLAELCAQLARSTFVTVDTEFHRESTYWPKLCLVQVAGEHEAAAIDPLAEGIDLDPLWALLADERVLKVMHAGRQDVEIVVNATGRVPAPLFDTQVAAMVCGFGDSASYETLATRLADARIDKASRFTDWARRPLTERQLAYALDDVTYLRTVYTALAQRLAAEGRSGWIEDEMRTLTDPATYAAEPREAWRRLKPRTDKPRVLAVLREVAAWRETEAQRRDLPRNRVIRDEALLEIAANPPTSAAQLARVRGLPGGFAEGRHGEALLAAVQAGLDLPADQAPQGDARVDLPNGIGPAVELLKVLLRIRCEEHRVAPKLVASSADLDQLAASDSAAVKPLQGWRRGVFGEDALRLKRGELALGMKGRRIAVFETPAD